MKPQGQTFPEACLLLREADGMDTTMVAQVLSDYRMLKPFEQICCWWGMLDTTNRGICSALRAGSSGADFSHPLLPIRPGSSSLRDERVQPPWPCILWPWCCSHYCHWPQGMVYCFLGAGLRQAGLFICPDGCHQTASSSGWSCSQQASLLPVSSQGDAEAGCDDCCKISCARMSVLGFWEHKISFAEILIKIFLSLI